MSSSAISPIFSGCQTGMPWASATVLISGGTVELWLRPTGLSGWVMSRHGLGPCSMRWRKVGRAMSPVAMKAIFKILELVSD